jgi:hypothetical protein
MKSTTFYAAEYDRSRKTGERYLETFPFDIQPAVGDGVSIRIGGESDAETVQGEVVARRWELRAVRDDNGAVFDAILRVVIRE